MNLKLLLSKVKPLSITGSQDIDISGVCIDSRKVEDGNMFVAICGTQSDGHLFIDKAINGGATAVACQKLPEDIRPDVTYIVLEDTEDAVGKIATQFYGDPTARLKLIGVTGTNGKTTIATLLFKMFRQMGFKCGLCSTVCNYIEDKAWPTARPRLTPSRSTHCSHKWPTKDATTPSWSVAATPYSKSASEA